MTEIADIGSPVPEPLGIIGTTLIALIAARLLRHANRPTVAMVPHPLPYEGGLRPLPLLPLRVDAAARRHWSALEPLVVRIWTAADGEGGDDDRRQPPVAPVALLDPQLALADDGLAPVPAAAHGSIDIAPLESWVDRRLTVRADEWQLAADPPARPRLVRYGERSAGNAMFVQEEIYPLGGDRLLRRQVRWHPAGVDGGQVGGGENTRRAAPAIACPVIPLAIALADHCAARSAARPDVDATTLHRMGEAWLDRLGHGHGAAAAA